VTTGTASRSPIFSASFGRRFAAVAVAIALAAGPSAAADAPRPLAPRSIMDTSVTWPSAAELIRGLTLRDYNTRVVVLGTTVLGAAAGVVGTFAYLRRRALVGDALAHATLPGVAAVFLIWGTRNLPALLAGAALTGVLGVLAMVALRHVPRIKEDAAIGIVLSVFFGAGMALFSIVQQQRTGREAGLANFIYGKAAALVQQDLSLISAAALLGIAGIALFYKEFRLVCFDPQFAAAAGWPVPAIDLLLMALVVLITVVALQAVGLILIVALLIIPAAAARFWTDRLAVMLALAGLFGALAGWTGATISALAPRLPTGAVIVLCAGILFGLSLLGAPQRGVVAALLRRVSLRRRVALQHLLRALAEQEERAGDGAALPWTDLLRARAWSAAALRRLLRRAQRAGLVPPRLAREGAGQIGVVRLTAAGRVQARRVLRNHRLWELFLIRQAHIAPSHVHRDADEIEHVLSPAIIAELERALAARDAIPRSPHANGAAP